MDNRVIVLSGIPGSGKSTAAQRYRFAWDAKIVSADDFFTDDDGRYHFNPAQIADAHATCLRSFVSLLQMRWPVVVVDNTNTTAIEVAPYMALAQAFGYEALLLTVRADAALAHARNVHGVPLHTVERMALAISERVCPPWWRTVEVASPYEVLP